MCINCPSAEFLSSKGPWMEYKGSGYGFFPGHGQMQLWTFSIKEKGP